MKYTETTYPIKWSYTGRHEDVIVGVFHFISAINMPGFHDKPFNIQEILRMFKEGVEWGGKTHHFSAHRLINRNGDRYNLVALRDRAWHVGDSYTDFGKYRTSVNNFSNGYELVATENSGYTEEQYESLAEAVLQDNERLMNQHLGKMIHFVGHDWVAGQTAYKLGLRKDIKKDPGKLFDWDRFHDEYICQYSQMHFIPKPTPPVKPKRRSFMEFFRRFRFK